MSGNDGAALARFQGRSGQPAGRLVLPDPNAPPPDPARMRAIAEAHGIMSVPAS